MAVVNVFRRRFVVSPSKIVTNACGAVCILRGDLLPGLGAQQFGRALFVAGRFDKLFSKIPQIARFGLGISAREFPGRKSGVIVDRPYGLPGARPDT